MVQTSLHALFENKNHVTCFIVIVALLSGLGIASTISLRCVCIGTGQNSLPTVPDRLLDLVMVTDPPTPTSFKT